MYLIVLLLTFVLASESGSLAQDIESAINPVYGRCRRNSSLDLQHDNFDWDLFGKFNQGKVNTLVSPISLKLVLAMLYLGSEGRIRDQIMKVLDFESNDTLLRMKFKSIRKCWKQNGPYAIYILNVGTRMYVEKSTTVMQKYSAILADNFLTEIKKVDKDNPAEAVLDANQWIKEITRGNINQLLTDDGFFDVMILMLSSLHFEGSWTNQFQPNETKIGMFYLNGEDSVIVPMMTQIEKFGYSDSRDLQAKILKMKFRGEGLSMTIVLPNSINGLPKLMSNLTASKINHEMMLLRQVNVRVTIPKFKYSFKSQLVPVLKEMGITDLFESLAFLPAFRKNLIVNNILQKVGIVVNEKGTTTRNAAAVTLANKSVVDEEQPEDFMANKPFLFFLEDDNTKQILFSGTVNNPTKTTGELGQMDEASAPSIRSSTSSCLLPSFPANGWYNSSSGTGVPGDDVKLLSVLVYSCDPGFSASDRYSICLRNNVWDPTPTCAKLCKLYNSYTVDYMCFSPKNQHMDCEPDMKNGSYVGFNCKVGHIPSGTQTQEEMICHDGSWSRSVLECEPDCGLEIADGLTFIVNATIAPKGALPWHVAVYQGTDPAFAYICGGTLISSRLVVSAAHCFHDMQLQRVVALPAHLYRVAANKHYREWDHQAEPNAPKSEVREIRIHNHYTGELHHQQYDLALLILKNPFEFTQNVGAVCFDLRSQIFDSSQLSSGNIGKFAGWGLTEKQRLASELRVLSVPIISHDDCRIEYERYNTQRYITSDKICAGFLNGSTGCNGDSGAGLVFSSPRDGQKRWWLRGVLSIGPRDGEFCRTNTYTAYTRIFALGDWLKQQINHISSQLYHLPVSRDPRLRI